MKFLLAIGTSLSVMISNNLISMFALDRKYIMYAVTAEKLKAVGWKYFELSDMFCTKTHLENWVLFWNEVEKIKRLQVIAEFTDDSDKNHEPNPANAQSPDNSDNDDSDSDNTPRSPDTPPLNLIEKYHIPVENIKIKLNIIQKSMKKMMIIIKIML